MIELNGKQREKLKSVQLELLDEFASFCKEHHLTFYLFGGTLLGALRHGGFIPWDDDVDVCMPRKDYDRFCELYKETDIFFLQNTKTDRYYFYHFAKLMKKGTLYREYFTQNINAKKHIFIDIFPINGYPNKSNFLSLFHYNFWLFVLNKRSYPKCVCKTRTIKRNATYRVLTVLSWLLLWWAPFHLCAKMRNDFMKRHQFKRSPNCIVGTNLRKIYSRDFFEGTSKVQFEGRTMPAMGEPSKYLTKMYGDYMQLPPENERTPHHYLVEFKA